MSLIQYKLQVLTILSENLEVPRPQLVPSSVIAEQMGVHLSELQQVLKCMEGVGVIETDPEQQYNLITQEGVRWLNRQRLVV